MIDYQLRFPNEAVAMPLLEGLTAAVDVIGPHNDYFLVDVRATEEIPALLPYAVTPLEPVRVWA